MSTLRQIDFFINLLDDRAFPPETPIETLLERFKTLDDKSASVWIEKAIKLPKRDEPTAIDVVPAPF